MGPTLSAEAELVRGTAVGDEQAIRLLFRQCTPRLRAILYQVCNRDVDLVEDLVQETWLHALSDIRRFRGDGPFERWLVGIGVRLALSHHRTAQRRASLLQRASPRTAPQPDDAELIDLERAIASLPETQRAVIVLQAICGYPHSEVASVLDMSVGSARVALSRARARLRILLNGRQSDESDP